MSDKISFVYEIHVQRAPTSPQRPGVPVTPQTCLKNRPAAARRAPRLCENCRRKCRCLEIDRAKTVHSAQLAVAQTTTTAESRFGPWFPSDCFNASIERDWVFSSKFETKLNRRDLKLSSLSYSLPEPFYLT